MPAIFYDLETSDQNFVGQILNYSFIAVDKDFEILDECSGDIKLNRLQLPSPFAILANRIDVFKHQAAALDSEKAAAIKIVKFIEKQLLNSEKAVLIGYNSSRFDLPFLRTTLIRNGINPYFYGKLVYRDLLHLSRKLSISQPDFPRMEGKEKGRLSLSLETLCNAFGLLIGKQAHASRDDVLITIKLARAYKEKYHIDAREYEAYEALSMHNKARNGKVFKIFYPQYDLSLPNLSLTAHSTLLDADHRTALWVDLDKYKEGKGRKSISWYSRQTSSLYLGEESKDEEMLNVSNKALEEFKSVNLKNYFEQSTCDIEQDIYRLDISMINNLFDVIWQGNKAGSRARLNKDAKVVFLRNELANYEWGNRNDSQVEDKLRQYGLYRYGGKMQMSKFTDSFSKEGERREAIHPTLKELLANVESDECNSTPEDKKLMHSLKKFYLNSDIYRLCGEELLNKDTESNLKAVSN